MIVSEARKITNLPDYLDQRLVSLTIEIERINCVRRAIQSVRDSFSQETLNLEKKKIEQGSQLSLVS